MSFAVCRVTVTYHLFALMGGDNSFLAAVLAIFEHDVYGKPCWFSYHSFHIYLCLYCVVELDGSGELYIIMGEPPPPKKNPKHACCKLMIATPS